MKVQQNNSTLACIFPGQGSQSVAMLATLAKAFPVVQQIFSQASTVLNYDLWRLVQEGPESALNQTDKTQPAMLAAGVAVWQVWQECGGATPALMAGHSLGEYTALVCAGALAYETAVRIVAERGRAMQEAVPEGAGAMAAILGLEDDVVREICTQAAQQEVVAAVNFNSPGQVVIAGTAAAVGRAIEGAKAAGARRAIMLPVSVPSHCLLMKPAAERMASMLQTIEITTPLIPVINNVDVLAETAPQHIKQALVRQLYNPVRWVETIQAMQSKGARLVLECGPGKVLAGLNRRIDRQLNTLPVFDESSLRQALLAAKMSLETEGEAIATDETG